MSSALLPYKNSISKPHGLATTFKKYMKENNCKKSIDFLEIMFLI